MNRRNVLKGIAAVGAMAASGIEVDAAPLEKGKFSEAEEAFHRDFGAGGKYFRALHDRARLTDRLLQEMAGRMQDLSKQVAPIEAPWVRGRWIDKKNGGKVFVNESIVEFEGALYEIIAAHAIEESAEETKYIKLRDYDLAVRRLAEGEYSGPLPRLDGHLNRTVLSGHVGLLVGERGAEKHAFSVPLAPMTPVLYDRFFGTSRIPEPHATHIKSSLWTVLPPDEAMVIGYDARTNSSIPKVKGRSGSMNVIRDPKNGELLAAGIFFWYHQFLDGPLRGTIIACMEPPEALVNVARIQQHEYSMQEETKRRPAER